jgi:hypothetical protein
MLKNNKYSVMKRALLVLFVVCLGFVGYGQTAASYLVSRATGTYTSIQGLGGTTATTAITADDATLTSISIGFTFRYCGTNYTTLSMCSNGWASLNNSAAANWFNSGMGVVDGGVGFLSCFWDDLNGSGSVYCCWLGYLDRIRQCNFSNKII